MSKTTSPHLVVQCSLQRVFNFYLYFSDHQARKFKHPACDQCGTYRYRSRSHRHACTPSPNPTATLHYEHILAPFLGGTPRLTSDADTHMGGSRSNTGSFDLQHDQSDQKTPCYVKVAFLPLPTELIQDASAPSSLGCTSDALSLPLPPRANKLSTGPFGESPSSNTKPLGRI